MLTVEGGSEVFGGERHGEGRLIAEVRLVVHVLEERRLDDEPLAVRTVEHADVVVQADCQLAVHFCLSVGGGDDERHCSRPGANCKPQIFPIVFIYSAVRSGIFTETLPRVVIDAD